MEGESLRKTCNLIKVWATILHFSKQAAPSWLPILTWEETIYFMLHLYKKLGTSCPTNTNTIACSHTGVCHSFPHFSNPGNWSLLIPSPKSVCKTADSPTQIFSDFGLPSLDIVSVLDFLPSSFHMSARGIF
jgi:hypothetical protein